jgi:glycine/D-amino acid oxidase-like deaminating enzyme
MLSLRAVAGYWTWNRQIFVTRKSEIVICGAGIAGISAAYYLAKAGFNDILIVDPLPPLSLTSDRSTECYRNWWPDPEMVALMDRSVVLMEELAAQSGNIFRMNRRGYLYLIANESRIADFTRQAESIAELGAGPLRIHSSESSGYQPGEPAAPEQASGADLLLDPALIRRHYPYATDQVIAALHVRRAGWLSAQQLGMHFLECARGLGVRLEHGTVEATETSGGRVSGIVLANGEHIACAYFVNAAGPYLKHIGAMLGLDIPVRTELHLKVTFKDHLGIVRRDAPLMIWDDPQFLPWDSAEREALSEDPATRWLTEPFPAGVHMRPEGAGDSQNILMLWDYKSRWMEPVFPPPLDDLYPEVALRGLSTMLPGLSRYFDRSPRPYLDGGYYVKTPENRLLACPLPVQGAFVIGALSGFGIMTSCAAGELLASHVAGSALPAYAPAFSIDRYSDPNYMKGIDKWESTGQL